MDSEQVTKSLQPLFNIIGNYPWLKAVAVILIALLLAKLVELIVLRLVKGVAARTHNVLDDQIVDVLHRPLFWSVTSVGAVIAIQLLDVTAFVYGIAYSVIATWLILLWARVAMQVSRSVLNAIARRKNTTGLIRTQTEPLFQNLAFIVVIALAVYFMFQAWDIDMTAWLASAGVAGIAIGFAAKDTLANLFSGVFILADGPYKIGDYVVLDTGMRGEITHIGIRSTRLLTRDDVEVTIPNSIMGNTQVTNESGGPHEKFRIRVQVAVAYGSDVDQVREVLMDVAGENEAVCSTPEARVRFRTFGASGLDFELLCWIDKPELRGRVLDSLNTQVYKRFMAEAIEIPYQKTDLYIKELPETG